MLSICAIWCMGRLAIEISHLSNKRRARLVTGSKSSGLGDYAPGATVCEFFFLLHLQFGKMHLRRFVQVRVL